MAKRAMHAVLVVDSHPIWRRGIVASLEAQRDLQICGQGSELRHIGELIRSRKPDLIIVDIGSEPIHGIETIKSITAQFPSVAILVASFNDEYLYAERALRAGAKGYLGKTESNDVLVSAIRQVLRGGVYLSAKMREVLLKKALHGKPSDADGELASLSNREFEVFMLLGNGKLNREIARHMKISVKTVDAYRAHIKQKLHLKNAMQLTRMAFLHAHRNSSAAHRHPEA